MSVISVKSPTLSSSNGLTRHQSMEDWRMSPTKNKGKYPPCDCCPYGYHIDLDFVRFCEAMAQGNTGDPASKQRRRERRRQRQSMEVMLGLASPPTWVTDNKISEILQTETETVMVKNEGSACASEPVRDALQKAVMDFEETLQRSSSGRRSTTNNWLPDVVAVFL